MGCLEIANRSWGSSLAPPKTLANAYRDAADSLTPINLSARAAQVGMMAALDAVQRPALLINGLEQVVCMNEAAEAVIGDGIMISQRRLRAAHRASDAALQALLQSVSRLDAAPARCGRQSVALPRVESKPLIVQIVSLATADNLFGEAKALVTINRLENPSEPAVSLLAQAFGLTAAEQKLARQLALGGGVMAASNVLGVSASTVRTHLKGIFAKTDTHSQSELAALLSQAGQGLHPERTAVAGR